MNKLWTRNFTIITFGTIISMLGNAVAGFALGVLILEMTNSSLAFALYLALNSVPRLLVPILAGTFLDRFSRVKVIYTLDFFSAFVYLFIFYILKTGQINFSLFLILTLIIGIIDSFYSIAYDSLYPNYITKGNFSKAYSISSMLYPIAAFMTPVAAFVHKTIGLEVLFIFNAISFFIAAIFETFLNKDETHLKENTPFKLENFKKEFSTGLKYIYLEKGLLTITMFFFFNSLFQGSVSQTLEMPYFKNNPNLGYTLFTYVSSVGVLGRFIGGFLHYRYKIKNNLKFKIAMIVYIIICFTNGFSLFMPFTLKLITHFITGLLSVTSYNIRISSTQAYVPDELRGRFNGTFQMMTTSGMILGQLIWGFLGENFDPRYLVLIGNGITLLITYLVVYRRKETLKPIYNQVL